MRRGFTLVELLVVLAILSVLLAILVPTTQRVRRQAISVECKARLADIGKAMVIYLNDNDNRFPPARMGPGPNPGTPLDTVRTYWARNNNNVAEVWRCPAEEDLFEQHGLSFSYNQELGTTRLVDTISYKSARATSTIPTLWDATNDHGGSRRKNFLMADGSVTEFLANTVVPDLPPGAPQ